MRQQRNKNGKKLYIHNGIQVGISIDVTFSFRQRAFTRFPKAKVPICNSQKKLKMKRTTMSYSFQHVNNIPYSIHVLWLYSIELCVSQKWSHVTSHIGIEKERTNGSERGREIEKQFCSSTEGGIRWIHTVQNSSRDRATKESGAQQKKKI